jgi:hypothetical protein
LALRAFFTHDLRLQFHEVDEDVSLPPQLNVGSSVRRSVVMREYAGQERSIK